MRSLIFPVATIIFLSASAFAQNVGDSCVEGTDVDVCSGTELLVCQEGVYASIVDCPSVLSGTVCGTVGCSGDCPDDFVTCIGNSVGDDCIGLVPLLDQDSSNDAQFFGAPCQAGLACEVTFPAGTESCQQSPNNIICSSGSPSVQCVGDKLVICVSFEGGAGTIQSPGVLDCASDGLTCGLDTDGELNCVEDIDPRCGGGDGSCQGSVAVNCSEGVVVDERDCANFGQACVDEGFNFGCIIPDPECGANGLGLCTGTVASICQGGSFVTETDCSDLGRRCGALDGNGQIGCVADGGGEGEGEGEGECSSDSDCDDDEECDDGQCRRVRSSRDRGEPEPEPSPFAALGCQQSHLTPLSVAGLALLAVRRRRRA
jgi:hypothetical protein